MTRRASRYFLYTIIILVLLFAGRTTAAPFSDAAVQHATTHTLRLLSSQEGRRAAR